MTNTDMNANIDIIHTAIESENDGQLQVAQDHIASLGERRRAAREIDFNAVARQAVQELETIENELRSSNVRLSDQRSSSSLKSAELAPKARRLEALLDTVEAARGGDDE